MIHTIDIDQNSVSLLDKLRTNKTKRDFEKDLLKLLD